MPISLDYAQTRALAKKFREITGREVAHAEILTAISSVVGMPMDGMMHKLKAEARTGDKAPENPWDPAWKPGASTLRTFDAIPRHPDLEMPDFTHARPFFELMIRKAPRRTRYAFVMLQIDNLADLSSSDAAEVFSRLAAGLRGYIDENRTLAACTRRGEVVILLDDVDAMDEEDPTLGWLSKVLPFAREKAQPEVLITAVVAEIELEDPDADPMLDDVIEASRESLLVYNERRSTNRFVWGPTAY